MKPAHHRPSSVRLAAAVTTTLASATFALVLGAAPASAHCGTPQAEPTCPDYTTTTSYTPTSGSYGSTTTVLGTTTLSPTSVATTVVTTPTTAATTTTASTAPATTAAETTTTIPVAASTTAPDATTVVETTLPRGLNPTTTASVSADSATPTSLVSESSDSSDASTEGAISPTQGTSVAPSSATTGVTFLQAAGNAVPVVATDTDTANLPVTGDNPVPLIVGGAGAIIAGLALLFLTRRRAHRLGL